MKVKDICALIENELPLHWQESFDNAGLAVGDPEAEVSQLLIALDATEEVIDEAISIGAQMVITHHPIIFRPLKRIACENRQQRTILRALQHGIALYAAHTNLDSAPSIGISHHIASLLGIHEVALLEASSAAEGVGLGIVGQLAEPAEPTAFLRLIKERLGVVALRHSPVRIESISRVAICSGSGGSLIEAAEAASADVYIAADFKYHDFVDADTMILVDAGHFETEFCAIDILHSVILNFLPTFAVRKSAHSTNPVCYLT